MAVMFNYTKLIKVAYWSKIGAVSTTTMTNHIKQPLFINKLKSNFHIVSKNDCLTGISINDRFDRVW